MNCLESFCTVTKSKLGENTKLLLGGEVDCWNGIAEGLSGYVELKTSRKIDTKKQRANFEKFKLLKWWAQSFTVGVRQILVGFRDDDGMVQKMQNLETMKLPSYALAADKKNAWRPEVALTFAEKVLTFIRETMEKYRKTVERWWSLYQRGQKANRNLKSPLSRTFLISYQNSREMLQMSARDLLSRDEEKRKKILASQAPPTISFSGQESENSAGGSIDQSHHHASRPHDSSSPDFAAEIAKSGSGGSGGSHRFKNASQLALNRNDRWSLETDAKSSSANAKKRAR